ncbi:dATP pyrophosphohydrolase [Aestuariivirga sp.]|jgi:hypothetical protein|uniref:dATP pyrophosphohydrolase n=1 Tax=Aestuariivirga sp. TaxID=2650926 RepID=UPI003783F8E0
MVQSVSIRPVRSKADVKAFLDVPFALYRSDPHWVAPLHVERQEHLDRRRNPYFQHAEAELFLAVRDGRPVGRISAQLCSLRTARYQDGVGQFGFLEAEDDASVMAALTEAAGSWLLDRGARHMQGPFSFSINDESGLLVEGFDTPPSIMMGHARPYYAARLTELGFGKAKDLIAYGFADTGTLPRGVMLAAAKARADHDIRIRSLDKKRLAAELRTIVDIANDAWSDNWGFVPWTEAEMTALGNNLRMLVSGDYIAIVEYRGEAAAMAVSLPNINDWLAGLNGRLLPLGWAKLAWNLFSSPPRSVRIPLMGVRRKFHGTAVGAVLGMSAIVQIRDFHTRRGTRQAELSWILEDNLPMRSMIESFGGRPYKTYRIFEKQLAPP